MELAEVVGELYGLTPGRFIARRDALARQLRAEDAALAGAVKKLRKPSGGAWLANMLARHRQADLAELLELGAALRQAQEELDGEQLRRLAGERNPVLARAVAAARAVAEQLGEPAGDAAASELEQTLRAALTDEEAAATAVSGQLVRGLVPPGFGPVEVDGAVADPASVPAVPTLPARTLRPVGGTRAEPAAEPDGTSSPGSERARREEKRDAERAARREAAQARVAAATEAADALQATLTASRQELAAATEAYERLAADLARLRHEAADTERALVRAKRELRDAERARRSL